MQGKRERETSGYAGRIKTSQRFLRAAVKADDLDLPHLADLADNVKQAEACLKLAALRLHDEEGCSWASIAEVLGITRQAARQRFSEMRDQDVSQAPVP